MYVYMYVGARLSGRVTGATTACYGLRILEWLSKSAGRPEATTAPSTYPGRTSFSISISWMYSFRWWGWITCTLRYCTVVCMYGM